MLDRTLIDEIEMRAARLGLRSAAMLEALRLVQDREGEVTDEHVREVASLLGVGPAWLGGIASLFDRMFRRPAGEHVVRVCDATRCWVHGGEHLADALTERLGIGFGETTPDGAFTLQRTGCVGACERAPVVRVDDDVHPAQSPHALALLLARYRRRR